MTDPADLSTRIEQVRADLDAANQARELALPGCRAVIRHCGSSIKAVHRLQFDRAAELADAAEAELRQVQAAVADHPAIEHAGFLHDAEKEYVEARAVRAFVDGVTVPSASELAVGGPAYLRGLAEAASELRRHLLDRLREGDVARAEQLLGLMDDTYDALSTVDYPDAVTHGLRRTLDALRAVLERSRGDLTTSVLQLRLQQAIESDRP
ncbi:MAG: haloacid dehalogenase [Gordonia sp. (in: high G+C Gram-positive bacteria)]|nr:MAG: haloacid dehalogenase [Gordonia sp. (in: high G+C Gram-positive bacteria)]